MRIAIDRRRATRPNHRIRRLALPQHRFRYRTMAATSVRPDSNAALKASDGIRITLLLEQRIAQRLRAQRHPPLILFERTRFLQACLCLRQPSELVKSLSSEKAIR